MDHQLWIWGMAMHILAFATDPTQEFYILSQSNLEYFFAFNKMKWKYISGLWQSLLPFQVGQEAMFCNSGTTLLYLVLHFFFPPTNFFSWRQPFFHRTFFYLFHLIISSMYDWASMLHSSHIFLIWRSFYLCSDDIKPSGWEQDLHTLQFHSLFMRKVTQWPPHDNCNCTRSSFIF